MRQVLQSADGEVSGLLACLHHHTAGHVDRPEQYTGVHNLRQLVTNTKSFEQ